MTVNRAFALRRFLARRLNENISVIAYACGESPTYFQDGCVKESFRGDLGPDRQVAEALLSADYAPATKERKPRAPREVPATETDAEAPFGRKKNGTKQRPGRGAKAE